MLFDPGRTIDDITFIQYAGGSIQKSVACRNFPAMPAHAHCNDGRDDETI